MSVAFDSLIATLRQMFENGVFPGFIQRIRFPYFKNMEEGSQINFTFPITVLVGQNGCGKSSVLQALYGAPEGQSVRDFWFSTEVDPIVESRHDNLRHSFSYSYGKSGEVNSHEVLKCRIKKANNPEYWEPSRPYKKYGLQQGSENRVDPVAKNVVYLDFRGELSAFDKYFYFREPSTRHKAKTKQDYIRRKSVQLKGAIWGSGRILHAGRAAQNEPVERLNPALLAKVSGILGRQYTAGRIIRHKLYEDWGTSAMFSTPTKTYSEAYAGSGEMAVLRLVSDVVSAPSNSLILLDEPEVSLHPGAQKRMLEFLMEEAKSKHHQVIISSHSPSIVEELPKQAIKLFHELPSGKFAVQEEVSPKKAFFYIGSHIVDKKEIILEDRLAQQIVRTVATSIDVSLMEQFELTYRPGGSETIVSKHIPLFSEETPCNKFVLLDGDKRRDTLKLDELPASIRTSDEFQKHLKDILGTDIQFFPCGGNDPAGKERVLVEQIKKFATFWDNRVFFLPKLIPEEIIWNEDVCINLVKTLCSDPEAVLGDINAGGDCKEKLFRFTKAVHGDAEHYDSDCSLFLKKWLSRQNSDFGEIVAIIEEICARG